MTASQTDNKLEKLYRDCRDLARYIAHARREVAAMRPHELKSEKLPQAGQELDTIVKETEAATNSIMAAAEAIMGVDSSDIAAYKIVVETECMKIFEACSFQDITGQRIQKVVQTLVHIEHRLEKLRKAFGADLADSAPAPGELPTGDAALLHGPQLHGQGVDQASVDAMFVPPAARAPAAAPAKPNGAAKPQTAAAPAKPDGAAKPQAAAAPAKPNGAAKPQAAAAPAASGAVAKTSQTDIDAMFD